MDKNQEYYVITNEYTGEGLNLIEEEYGCKGYQIIFKKSSDDVIADFIKALKESDVDVNKHYKDVKRYEYIEYPFCYLGDTGNRDDITYIKNNSVNDAIMGYFNSKKKYNINIYIDTIGGYKIVRYIAQPSYRDKINNIGSLYLFTKADIEFQTKFIEYTNSYSIDGYSYRMKGVTSIESMVEKFENYTKKPGTDIVFNIKVIN